MGVPAAEAHRPNAVQPQNKQGLAACCCSAIRLRVSCHFVMHMWCCYMPCCRLPCTKIHTYSQLCGSTNTDVPLGQQTLYPTACLCPSPSGLNRSSRSMSKVGALLVSSACSDTTSRVGLAPPSLSWRACMMCKAACRVKIFTLSSLPCRLMQWIMISRGAYLQNCEGKVLTLQKALLGVVCGDLALGSCAAHKPPTCTCFQTFCLSSGCRCRATWQASPMGICSTRLPL